MQAEAVTFFGGMGADVHTILYIPVLYTHMNNSYTFLSSVLVAQARMMQKGLRRILTLEG